MNDFPNDTIDQDMQPLSQGSQDAADTAVAAPAPETNGRPARNRKQTNFFSQSEHSQGSGSGREIRGSVLDREILHLEQRNLENADSKIRTVLTACHYIPNNLKRVSPALPPDAFCMIDRKIISKRDACPPALNGKSLRKELVDAYGYLVMSFSKTWKPDENYKPDKIQFIYLPFSFGNSIVKRENAGSIVEVVDYLRSKQITDSSRNLCLLAPFSAIGGDRQTLVCVVLDSNAKFQISLYEIAMLRHDEEILSYQSFFNEFFKVQFTCSTIHLEGPGIGHCHANVFVCVMMDLKVQELDSEKCKALITTKHLNVAAEAIWGFMYGFVFPLFITQTD